MINNSQFQGRELDWENRGYAFGDYETEQQYEKRQKALRDSFEPNGDTHSKMTLDEYIAKILEQGFEEVGKTDFTHSHFGRDRVDTHYVFAHRDGWVITMDTYTFDNGFEAGVDQGFSKKEANQLTLFYNWRPTYLATYSELTSSGHYITSPEQSGSNADGDDRVWSGNHDVREGLIHVMRGLKDNGTILQKWVDNPITFLAAHHSVKDQDRSVPPGQPARDEYARWLGDITTIATANYDALPEWVKSMMGPLSR